MRGKYSDDETREIHRTIRRIQTIEQRDVLADDLPVRHTGSWRSTERNQCLCRSSLPSSEWIGQSSLCWHHVSRINDDSRRCRCVHLGSPLSGLSVRNTHTSIDFEGAIRGGVFPPTSFHRGWIVCPSHLQVRREMCHHHWSRSTFRVQQRGGSLTITLYSTQSRQYSHRSDQSTISHRLTLCTAVEEVSIDILDPFGILRFSSSWQLVQFNIFWSVSISSASKCHS